MTKGKEELRDFIKLAVFEAFEDSEKKIDNLCQKNIKLAVQGHELDCPMKQSRIRSITTWSSLMAILGLVTDKIASYIGK